MKSELEKFLKDSIKNVFNIELDEIKLTNPPKGVSGDFSFNAGILARDLKKNPVLIAEDFKNFLDKQKNDLIENIEVLNAFINIKLSKSIFTKRFLKYIEKLELGYPQGGPMQKDGKDIGKVDREAKGTIIIDYIGANIGKPLHIGHMCTPNLGQAMINIYRKLGYNVIGDNHLGDWGIIFGKLIFAYKYFGEKKDELEKNPIEYLLKLYIDITAEAEKKPELDEKFRETFKKLSFGDKEYIELWKLFTSYSIKDLRKQLKRLNVYPDLNIGESFYEGLDLPKLEDIPDLECDMKCIVNELIEKKIATKNEDGSVGVVFLEETKIPSCILQKRDGTHGYLASDLAAIKYRTYNWNPEKIIYFVDVRQSLHFKQAFEIAKKAGWTGPHPNPLLGEEREHKVELFHAANGFISLKDGAMSTRKGRIIKLDKLLDEAETRAKKIILEKRDDIAGEELEELSKIIGIGAIKYGYLKKNRETDVIFDWDEFMSFEGNSGPYIQYAYVRARRILENGNFVGDTPGGCPDEKSANNIGYPQGVSLQESFFNSDYEIELIKKILEYNNILIQTTKDNYPHILANYAYELTKTFNSFYNNVSVLNEENKDLKNLKLLLIQAFADTLKESFGLLGIDMPERM